MTEFTPGSAIAGGAMIGLAAVLLMATTGRIAGVSGFLSRLLPPHTDDQWVPRLAFVLGIAVSTPLYAALTGSAIEMNVTDNPVRLITAGLLVGVGAVAGGGCTSGHGVCGLARGSRRSVAATAVFMGAALLTVFTMRHVTGG